MKKKKNCPWNVEDWMRKAGQRNVSIELDIELRNWLQRVRSLSYLFLTL